MEVSGQLHALADLPPGERAPCTHCIGGWVGPRAGLDAVENRKSSTAGNRTRALPACRYADWAFPLHLKINIHVLNLKTTHKTTRFCKGGERRRYFGNFRKYRVWILSFVGTEVLTAVVAQFCLPTAFTLDSCSAYSSTLKTEAIRSSKTSFDFQRTIRRYIPEDRAIHHDLYISHVSPDDGLSGPKHVLSGIINTFVCVTVPLPVFICYSILLMQPAS
jgi:hypothetical protein